MGMTNGSKRTNAILELLKQTKTPTSPRRRCLTPDEIDVLEYLGGIPGQGSMGIVSCRSCSMAGVVSAPYTGHGHTCQHVNGPFRLNMNVNSVHRDCPLREGPILVYLAEVE